MDNAERDFFAAAASSLSLPFIFYLSVEILISKFIKWHFFMIWHERDMNECSVLQLFSSFSV